MSTASLAQHPLLQSDFVREVIRQLRALDTHGRQDAMSDEDLLGRMILSVEGRRHIPIVSDPDAAALNRLHVFYSALAALIERECGLMASPILSLHHEGFGRMIIVVGKLVVLDKTLRDVHRFGFPELGKMKDESDRLLSVALNIISKHPDAAGM